MVNEMYENQITEKIESLWENAPDAADELRTQYKNLSLSGPHLSADLDELIFSEDDIADNNFSINSSEHDLIRDIQHDIVSILAIDN